uniref:Uncharacterized protein n=1 Tax=Sphaerodactylus townsendi TaxID=933632 RepID=A0ACB8FPR9_9SAUR
MSDDEDARSMFSESEPEPEPEYSEDPIYAKAPTIDFRDEGSIDVASSPAFQCLDEPPGQQQAAELAFPVVLSYAVAIEKTVVSKAFCGCIPSNHTVVFLGSVMGRSDRIAIYIGIFKEEVVDITLRIDKE